MLLKISSSTKGMSRWVGFFFLLITLFLTLALFSYDPNDLAFITTKVNDPAKNCAGVLGGWMAFLLFMPFGIASYLLPLLGLMISFSAFISRSEPHFWKKSIAGLAFVVLSSLLLSAQSVMGFGGLLAKINIPSPGGLVGQRVVGDILARYIGAQGAFLLLMPLWAASGILFFDIPWAVCFGKGRKFLARLPSLFARHTRRISPGGEKISLEISRILKRDKLLEAEPRAIWKKNDTEVSRAQSPLKTVLSQIPVLSVKPKKDIGTKERFLSKEKNGMGAAVGKNSQPKQFGAYRLPTLQLLDNPREMGEKEVHEDLQQNAKILQATLRDFGIDAEVVEVNRGPVITRYELQPAPGVKVNRITALCDDIALVMKAASVRIVAPIPGKAAVGIEVPNSKTAMVVLKELLVAEEFETSQAKIPLALGKDVSGKPIVADLTNMPHLLIAGATGSGKTVCVNSIILSILYTLTPDQCKLLLVDPKMVELASYRDLPHLVGPVVTDPKKVSAALHYAVREMEKRYRIFAEVGVRNIESFNARPNKEEAQPPPPQDTDAADAAVEVPEAIPATIPYVVIVIDELADLMMIAPVDIESAITRLAQLSRAVGIHMILATQRPSVDVITGVIKANFPARISFQVASKVDSRTILDANGADKLLGKGDMLFLPPGSSKLLRAQGTWVNDQEIQRVINFIKGQGAPGFSPEVFEAAKKEGAAANPMEEDALYDEAVEIVLRTQQASASVLQRRLRVGYARAARLLDTMEARGVVGAFRGSKARDILVKLPNPASAGQGEG